MSFGVVGASTGSLEDAHACRAKGAKNEMDSYTPTCIQTYVATLTDRFSSQPNCVCQPFYPRGTIHPELRSYEAWEFPTTSCCRLANVRVRYTASNPPPYDPSDAIPVYGGAHP